MPRMDPKRKSIGSVDYNLKVIKIFGASHDKCIMSINQVKANKLLVATGENHPTSHILPYLRLVILCLQTTISRATNFSLII